MKKIILISALFTQFVLSGLFSQTLTGDIDLCIDAYINSLPEDNGRELDNSIFDQEEINVVITDSGLGGLAVLDDIAKKVAGSGYYKRVNLVFVNALFNANYGYNSLNSREEKIHVFSSVLSGIENKFHPDVILIGCNTLSVIYRETDFVKESNTPVVGIVESGVILISDHLSPNKKSTVIITGTITTISEDSHRKALLKRGFSEERIITQACPELQSYIERNPDGEDTEMLITVYIEEAISKLPDDVESPYLSLNCSHFGYAEKLWQQAFDYVEIDLEEILNPNTIMGDVLMPEKNKNRYMETIISQSVYSKVVIRNKESMYNVFKEGSPKLAKALNNYVIDKDLF